MQFSFEIQDFDSRRSAEIIKLKLKQVNMPLLLEDVELGTQEERSGRKPYHIGLVVIDSQQPKAAVSTDGQI